MDGPQPPAEVQVSWATGLPLPVLEKILLLLPVPARARAACVCPAWRAVTAPASAVWSVLDLSFAFWLAGALPREPRAGPERALHPRFDPPRPEELCPAPLLNNGRLLSLVTHAGLALHTLDLSGWSLDEEAPTGAGRKSTGSVRRRFPKLFSPEGILRAVAAAPALQLLRVWLPEGKFPLGKYLPYRTLLFEAVVRLASHAVVFETDVLMEVDRGEIDGDDELAAFDMQLLRNRLPGLRVRRLGITIQGNIVPVNLTRLARTLSIGCVEELQLELYRPQPYLGELTVLVDALITARIPSFSYALMGDLHAGVMLGALPRLLSSGSLHVLTLVSYSKALSLSRPEFGAFVDGLSAPTCCLRSLSFQSHGLFGFHHFHLRADEAQRLLEACASLVTLETVDLSRVEVGAASAPAQVLASLAGALCRVLAAMQLRSLSLPIIQGGDTPALLSQLVQTLGSAHLTALDLGPMTVTANLLPELERAVAASGLRQLHCSYGADCDTTALRKLLKDNKDRATARELALQPGWGM